MKLSRDLVKKVAKLANLPLSAQEEQIYSEQLSRILDYVDQLNKADTENVDPTFNVTGSYNALAGDIPTSCLSADEALSNTASKKNGYFVTKGVFEET